MGVVRLRCLRFVKIEGWVVVELLAALWTMARPSSTQVGPYPSLAALPDAMLILLSLGFVVAIVYMAGLASGPAWNGPCFQFDACLSGARERDAAMLDATAHSATRFQSGTTHADAGSDRPCSNPLSRTRS